MLSELYLPHRKYPCRLHMRLLLHLHNKYKKLIHIAIFKTDIQEGPTVYNSTGYSAKYSIIT